ncbi:M81 family metallopeptidase [Pirellulales bacterium]|nr:M81 family metallopeptidase [Pirellulales bacterium]
MRVGILGLLQESNTFLPARTSWDDFANGTLVRGNEIREAFIDAPHEIGGFFQGLEAARIEPAPLFVARALPYGTIDSDSFARLLHAMLSELRAQAPLDGLLVAPHGATVSEDFPDADGHWLTLIREAVGPKTPIVGTLDPHANLSPKIVRACDALFAYRTNPHIDQRERGVEAAQLMARILAGTVRPTMAAQFPPLAISIQCQSTEEPPCRQLYHLADEMLDQPAVLSNSVLLGFPYADVPEMGSSVVVVTDNDQALADRLARELALTLWEHRQQLVSYLIGVDEAVRLANQAEPPVCLLDMGDNVGGGSPGDGTWLAHALRANNLEAGHVEAGHWEFEQGGEWLITLFDPPAVAKAIDAGVGARLRSKVGGHQGPLSGEPLEAEFVVQSLHDGKFTESKPRHGGYSSFDQGPTAVLSAPDGLTVVATSRRIVPFSLAQLTSCGLDPASYRILVAKGVNAPIAAYQEVCKSFIRVNTPGYTCADMTSLNFAHRRRPMFPFERDVKWLDGEP